MPTSEPMLGEIMKMGATMQAATAANAVEMANVSAETKLTLTPTSVAPSLFWATASIVLPNVVFLIKICSNKIMRKAPPITSRRWVDMVMPKTSIMPG